MKTLGDRFLDGFLVLLPVILSYLLLGALFDILRGLTVPLTDLLPGRLFAEFFTTSWRELMVSSFSLP